MAALSDHSTKENNIAQHLLSKKTWIIHQYLSNNRNKEKHIKT